MIIPNRNIREPDGVGENTRTKYIIKKQENVLATINQRATLALTNAVTRNIDKSRSTRGTTDNKRSLSHNRFNSNYRNQETDPDQDMIRNNYALYCRLYTLIVGQGYEGIVSISCKQQA